MYFVVVFSHNKNQREKNNHSIRRNKQKKNQKKESRHAVSRYAITSLPVSPLRVLPTTQETYEKTVSKNQSFIQFFHPLGFIERIWIFIRGLKMVPNRKLVFLVQVSQLVYNVSQ